MRIRSPKELSLRAKILLACLLLFTALIVFSLSVRTIKEKMPFLQFRKFVLWRNGSFGTEIKDVGAAFEAIRKIEGENLTLVLHDLKFSQSCDGYEYGIYVNEKNLKYVICQNGNYKVYRPVATGLEAAFEALNIAFNQIDKIMRCFFMGVC